MYIGSANYSNESANNIEAGILIKDKEFIKNLYKGFLIKYKKIHCLILTRVSVRSDFLFYHFMLNFVITIRG